RAGRPWLGQFFARPSQRPLRCSSRWTGRRSPFARTGGPPIRFPRRWPPAPGHAAWVYFGTWAQNRPAGYHLARLDVTVGQRLGRDDEGASLRGRHDREGLFDLRKEIVDHPNDEDRSEHGVENRNVVQEVDAQAERAQGLGRLGVAESAGPGEIDQHRQAVDQTEHVDEHAPFTQLEGS